MAINVDIDILDNELVKKFCDEKKIDLVIIGPETPLARGITDVLEKAGIKVCGPTYAASRMESSKIFAKQLMGRYDIPTARFRIFDDAKKAEDYIKASSMPIVIKADGLAGGKGVFVCNDRDEATGAVNAMLREKVFGAAGNKIIIEECLEGEELSAIVLTDGGNILPLESSQDHKRIYDGDKGPNTGGMGAYSPAPAAKGSIFKEINETILKPTIDGLASEGINYKGILYAGLMITKDGPKVLEYNVRLGDPETQAILPRMKTDFVELIMASLDGTLDKQKIEWDRRDCVCVVLASKGYPGKYEKDKEIDGLEEAAKEGAMVFHAGTKYENGKILTSGGRVLNVVSMGGGIKEAIANTYRAVEKISFDGMYYRHDIAHRALNRDL